MTIRTLAEFDSSLPVDGEEGPDGDYAEYPGRAISGAIAEILKGLGCDVEAPRHAHEHGWDFSFKSQGAPLWCQVGLIDRWLLICKPNPPMFSSSAAASAAHLALLPRLSEALGQDPRFSEIRWYTADEYESNSDGALSPLSEK